MPMGGLELVVILAIILLFVGAKRLPQLAKSLGVGARELKKAASEDADEGEAKAVPKGEQERETRTAVKDGPSASEDGRAGREPRDL
jgi:sec-independent protein translocase protein TatA